MVVDPKMLQQLARDLTDQGKLIEAGWIKLRASVVAVDMPDDRLRECRQAFFAGAHHLFGSIMHILDEHCEPSAADLRRVDLIDGELRTFIDVFQAEHGLGDGDE